MEGIHKILLQGPMTPYIRFIVSQTMRMYISSEWGHYNKRKQMTRAHPRTPMEVRAQRQEVLEMHPPLQLGKSRPIP